MTKTVPKNSVFVLARWKFDEDVLAIPFLLITAKSFAKVPKFLPKHVKIIPIACILS